MNIKRCLVYIPLILTIIFTCTLNKSLVLAQEPDSIGPDKRFGIVETYLNAQEATAAGAGYTRIILRWDVIQPAGRDDWKPANVPDPFIEAELAAGREITAILLGTPAWASNGINDSRAVPDMEAWGNFTKRIAQQYQGRIKHWIIWNEVDVGTEENLGSTWLGTEQDYLRLLQSAYSNIKNVDPTMRVYLAGLTYRWDVEHNREQYLNRLLTLIAADSEAERYDYYFDGVIYHLYYNPQQMLDTLTKVRAILDSYGLSHKPIWINETNAPPTDDVLEPPQGSAHFQVSSQEQAAFVIQAFALLIAGGAERVAFYKMRNSQTHPESIEPYGLLRHNDSRRPAFAAYQVVSKYFSGYSNYHWVRQGDFYIVTLDRQGQTTTIVWNTTPGDKLLSLNAIASQAILVDETGAEQPISASNGVYTFMLPGATCTAGPCFIGGAPRLLIEQGSSSQRAALLPLATATSTPTPLPLPTQTAVVSPTQPLVITPTPPIANNQANTALATATIVAMVTSVPNVSSPPQNLPQNNLTSNTTPNNQNPITEFSFLSVFTPTRILILVVLGALLFTFFYFIQYRLWQRFQR